ncbi:hypothetical protein [Streptomyces sp. ODS05-4]|uniref:hypothetical protein n=1 Tax=Streptomyces sp. ODS05-4 TaxID=2944939 RepID=UPI002109BD76|nr:hypothetical protein [Streptomyces sp. ODS05-4]
MLVTSVTGPVSDLDGKDFVLPDALAMSPAELARFDAEVAPDSQAFTAWSAEHRATVLSAGTLTVTLRGNAAEQVRIADIDVRKKCRPPLSGTHFTEYTQGSGDTVALGIDLDAADPQPQLRAPNTSTGPKWTGRNYFDERTLTLNPGEQETLAIGVVADRHHCAFTLELVVATADGVLTQPIDRQGRPFEVTGPAAPKSRPPAGYRAAYQERADGWHRTTPAAPQGER